jgi:molecular chaperone GrpE (heat shock protein)
MAEKDSDSNSSATETPEKAAKHEQSEESEPAQTSGEAEHSGKSAEEQSTMPEEDKEAILNSIATIEALIAEKESQLDELRERAVSSKMELENVKARLQRESDNARKFAVQV